MYNMRVGIDFLGWSPFRKRRFPPTASLLSNEEYYQQGVKETCKALEELREYCSSPKCNQWKTVLKLKDAKRYVKVRLHTFRKKIIETFLF